MPIRIQKTKCPWPRRLCCRLALPKRRPKFRRQTIPQKLCILPKRSWRTAHKPKTKRNPLRIHLPSRLIHGGQIWPLAYLWALPWKTNFEITFQAKRPVCGWLENIRIWVDLGGRNTLIKWLPRIQKNRQNASESTWFAFKNWNCTLRFKTRKCNGANLRF